MLARTRKRPERTDTYVQARTLRSTGSLLQRAATSSPGLEVSGRVQRDRSIGDAQCVLRLEQPTGLHGVDGERGVGNAAEVDVLIEDRRGVRIQRLRVDVGGRLDLVDDRPHGQELARFQTLQPQSSTAGRSVIIALGPEQSE